MRQYKSGSYKAERNSSLLKGLPHKKHNILIREKEILIISAYQCLFFYRRNRLLRNMQNIEE